MAGAILPACLAETRKAERGIGTAKLDFFSLAPSERARRALDSTARRTDRSVCSEKRRYHRTRRGGELDARVRARTCTAAVRASQGARTRPSSPSKGDRR